MSSRAHGPVPVPMCSFPRLQAFPLFPWIPACPADRISLVTMHSLVPPVSISLVPARLGSARQAGEGSSGKGQRAQRCLSIRLRIALQSSSWLVGRKLGEFSQPGHSHPTPPHTSARPDPGMRFHLHLHLRRWGILHRCRRRKRWILQVHLRRRRRQPTQFHRRRRQPRTIHNDGTDPGRPYNANVATLQRHNRSRTPILRFTTRR